MHTVREPLMSLSTGKPTRNGEGQPQSALFSPLKIANGRITLKHRVVHASLTRNRGAPLADLTSQSPNRAWVPDDVVTEYYSQRATDGGLLISEGIPPSLESNGMPGVPGLFCEQQRDGWKKVVEGVHSKGGVMYAQLWHAGRATIPQTTGKPTVAPSAVAWDDPEETYSHIVDGKKIRYADHAPIELSVEQIQLTIAEYVAAARLAMEAGFDGVELLAGNGYLPEQFLSSNVNKRTDRYGGSPEKRCTFVIELMEAIAMATGPDNLSIRLSPFGLFNQARGTERLETWTFLCKELKRLLPELSHVSFIEPRFEQIFSPEEKTAFLGSIGQKDVDLSQLRKILAGTPFFSAGGWNDLNCWGVIESGQYDGLILGRHFTSNPDLISRMKNNQPFRPYERDRFYGPFPDKERGYTDYTTYNESS